MFAPVFYAFVAAAVASGVAGQAALTINTPFNVAQCQPTLLQWTGGEPPYQLFVTSGDDSSGPSIQDLGAQTDNSETFIPTTGANTRIVFNLRDSTGLIAQTGIITIGGDNSETCEGASSASGGATTGGTTGGSTGTSGGASTTGGSTGTTRTTGTGTATGSSTATGSAASESDNAASAALSGAGFAGVLGAALVALLA